ncbi:type II toxin-antitoxin system HipA family toxin [Azotobacter chroococcum]|uniref:type II toxin-antitoxin system HipA family toxin n=1 Tax=Azotobacter chroococcum TaxID=353 RepID=UPI000B609D58|nr:type II toxin-antitoxin system HipA family toxin [Azotobacter chroococcum]ASL25595.1 transcriptional regulator [Azotobacter chroococcum]
MSSERASRKLKHIESLVVTTNGIKVGELYKAEAKGIYFTYDKAWLMNGYNLSPFTMKFDDKPQLAQDNLFLGLHGPFADSLPDGWGLLLMDRFFNSYFGQGTSLTLTQLDRLAYMGDRAMGAFEYHPKAEKEELTGPINLAQLFEASVEIQEGETTRVLKSLRLAGGSPGGARPKAIVALSPDGVRATSAFGHIPDGYDHWIVKFRAIEEAPETGKIEQAYALMAREAGVIMAHSMLLNVSMANGNVESFFTTKRFDRQGDRRLHMMTASALMYADFRAPTMDYSGMLKLTNVLTRSAKEVEKMARLMIFNALSHNYDDHTKNFAFLYNESENPGEEGRWTLAPAYDLTFSEARGEHTTAFSGHGKPTRKIIQELCKDYKYLKPDEYIDQTLLALSKWEDMFKYLQIPVYAGAGMFRVLGDLHKDFEGPKRRR